MKLWAVILYFSGEVGGSIGPLPYEMNECEERIISMNETLIRDNKPIRFVCQFHSERPKITKE